MRKFLFMLVVLGAPMTVWAIPGGKAWGEWCETSTDKVGVESSECDTGLVCAADFVPQTNGWHGSCIADCGYIIQHENTTDFTPEYMQNLDWQAFTDERYPPHQIYTICVHDTQDDAAWDGLSRCELGYYGYPIMLPADPWQVICTACPNGGVSNPAVTGGVLGGYTASSCMLPAGTTSTDTTGTFTVTADCPWVE